MKRPAMVNMVMMVAAILLLAGSFTATLAEVAVIRDGDGRVAGTLEIFEVGTTIKNFWAPVRTTADPMLLLNSDGDVYRDGAPCLVMNPVTSLPEAVWSYWDGAHYQIAWSRFDGGRWSMVQGAGGPDYLFLTSDDRQNFDPKIWIDAAGNRRVAWWRRSADAVDDVVVSVLPAGETQWWLPQRVSLAGVPARRPDIRTFPRYGTFIVAEEIDGGVLSVVVFDSPLLDGHTPQRGSDPWGRRRVQATAIGTPLSPTISAQPSPGGSVPVVSWRVEQTLAASYYDTEALAWSDPLYTTYPIWW